MSTEAYQLRFNYTTGEEFTLSGVNYVGFFNTYSDGTVYTDKYRTSTSKPLVSNSNFAADYYTTDHYKDLTVYDTYTLPYSLADVQVNINELINFTTINTKLSYLHQNLMYVYSKMFFGDTDVPFLYDKTAGISEIPGGFTGSTFIFNWYPTPNYTAFGSTTFAACSAYPDLAPYIDYDNLKRFVIVPSTNTDIFGIFGITDTRLIGLTSKMDLSDIGITLYADVIDEQSDEKCQNLSDLTYDGTHLYVTDSAINGGGQVFKYDISSYNTGDASYEFKRFLIRPIGGLGTKQDRNKFNGCTVIGSKPGYIFVADSGNGAVKIFDSNLVWIKTITLPRGNYKVLDIKHRPLNNHLYFLIENEDLNTFLLFEYDENYRYISTVTFEDALYEGVDNAFNRMVFSEQDSNVFYLSTDSTVYKKFFSNPTKTFATFKRQKFGQSPVTKWQFQSIFWNKSKRKWNQVQTTKTFVLNDIAILPVEGNFDSLFALGNGLILHFNEQTIYNTVLRNPKIPYYNLSRVQLELPENIQALTINKEIFKLFSNIVQVKNTLLGRFNFLYDLYGDLKYNNYKYFLDNEIDKLNVEINYNTRINDNELTQAGTFNKLFTQIYKLHEAMLELTKPVVTNYKSVVTNNNVLVIA